METALAHRNKGKIFIVLLIVLLVLAGSVLALYYLESAQEISNLNQKISSLNNTVALLQKAGTELTSANGTYPGTNFFNSGSNSTINPVSIYTYANRSVVTVEGLQTVNSVFSQATQEVLGSGFVIAYSNSDYIVTNFHVVDGDSNMTVTFSNGDAYSATVIGTDPYSDLAVLSSDAPRSEYQPLSVTSSSDLKVGESVLAIGNPFGLSGSMTFGIVSQLGRTLSEQTAGNYPIANVIQISTPINPGNSGGPLLNSYGQVVGMTTAIVSGSQGVGFAIPSDTILHEVPYLITTGSYMLHPFLGIESYDMSYDLSKAIGSNVTYGVLVENVVSGSPAASAGLKGGSTTTTVDGQQYLIGGDVIFAINGTRIVNGGALSSWLEENGAPNQVVQLGIIRSGSYMTIPVTLGSRPPLG
jgi:S1-C subfamily serine protease